MPNVRFGAEKSIVDSRVRVAVATYTSEGNFLRTVEVFMIRTDELANQLIVKVREFFPKPVRESLTYKVEGGSNGTGGTIVIRGRFDNQVPQFEPKLLTVFEGATTDKQKEAVTIKGKYQGVDCRIQLRVESLAAVAQ